MDSSWARPRYPCQVRLPKTWGLSGHVTGYHLIELGAANSYHVAIKQQTAAVWNSTHAGHLNVPFDDDSSGHVIQFFMTISAAPANMWRCGRTNGLLIPKDWPLNFTVQEPGPPEVVVMMTSQWPREFPDSRTILFGLCHSAVRVLSQSPIITPGDVPNIQTGVPCSQVTHQSSLVTDCQYQWMLTTL